MIILRNLIWIFIFIYTFVIFYWYESRVIEYKSQIVLLNSENLELKNRIDLIEENFDRFLGKKNRSTNSNDENEKTHNKHGKKSSEIHKLTPTEKNIEKFEKSLDSIVKLPNREGVNLINSLRLKTSK